MAESFNNQYMAAFVNNLSSLRSKLQKTGFLKYPYLIFLAGFFLAPSNSLHRNFYYLFVIAPFLLCIDAQFIADCRKSTLFKLSLLFLLYFLTSMFWSEPQLSSEEYYDQSRYFLMLIIFVLTTIMVSTDADQFIEKIRFWLCLTALIAAISFGVIFYSSNSFPAERLHGPFSYSRNPNGAAIFFGFAGILAFISTALTTITWQKKFYWSVTVVIFGYILLCQSRGPLLAFVISILVGSFFGKRWKAIGIFIALFAVSIIGIEFFDTGIQSFYERGFAYRLELWSGSLKNIAEAPLFGKGYFSDVNLQVGKRVLSPHNLLLLVSSKSGLIGGGILLLLISVVLVHSYKYFAVSGDWSFLCIFAFFLVCMTFDSIHLLHKPSLGWLIFWMPVALLAGKEIRGR